MTKPLRLLLVTLALATITRLPFIDSPFRADDFLIVRNSSAWLQELGQRTWRLAPTQRIDSMHRGNFRPTTWASHGLEVALQDHPGTITSHLIGLAIHLLTVTAVFLLGMRLGGRAAATIAAGLVAFHPAGAQAFSWISGRSDLLLGLTLCGSCLCALRGGPKWSLAAGVMAALAVGSKASSLAALPVLLLLVVVSGRGRRIRSVALWSLPVAASLFLRWLWLGSIGPHYYMIAREGVVETPSLLHYLGGLLEMIGELLLPSALDSRFQPATMRLLGPSGTGLLAALVALPPLVGVFAATGRARILAAFGALMMVSLPLLSIWSDACLGLAQNRNYYVPLIALAVLYSLAVTGLWHRGGLWRRALAVGGLASVLFLGIDSYGAYVRVDTEVARLVRGRVDSATELLAALPEDSLLVCVDPATEFCGQFLMVNALEQAFEPPFGDRPDRIVTESTVLTVPRLLRDHPSAAVVAVWDEAPAKFIVQRRFPEISRLHPLALAGEGDERSAVFVPPEALSGRGAPLVLVELASGTAANIRLRVDYGNSTRVVERAVPGRDRDGQLFAIELPEAEMADQELTRLTIDDPGASLRLLAPPVIVPIVPTEPDLNAFWSRAGFRIAGLGALDERGMIRIVAWGLAGRMESLRLETMTLEWDAANATRLADGSVLLSADHLRSAVPAVIGGAALQARLDQPPAWDFFWRVEFLGRDGRGRATRWVWSPFSHEVR